MNPQTQKRFEKLVVATGTLPQAVLEHTREKAGGDLPSHLVKTCGAERTRILQILAEVYRLPSVDMLSETPDPAAMDHVPRELCLRTRSLPLRIEEGHLVLAMADPEDLPASDEVRVAAGKPLRLHVALGHEIASFLEGKLTDVDSLVQEIVSSAPEDESEEESPRVRVSTESEASKPVVQLLDSIIANAAKQGAQHIYLVPFPDGKVRTRLFVDQEMVESKAYPARIHGNVVNRLRALSDLVGKDKRVPQSGAFLTVSEGRKHRVDVMIVPGQSGEAVTLFLDQSLNLNQEKRACSGCDEPLEKRWAYCPICGKKA